jgi:hypothetical protein
LEKVMDLKSIELLIEGIPLLIIEDRIFDVDHTSLGTDFDAIQSEQASWLVRLGPNPRFQGGRYYRFSHWTINGSLGLPEPQEFPDLRITTGARQRVTAWWFDAGTVWPPAPGGNGSVQQITVYAVSGKKGPLLNASGEIPVFAVDPATSWLPPGGRTISTRRAKVTLTAKSSLGATGEGFRAWLVPGSDTTKSDTPIATAALGEAGVWLAFYESPPKRPFHPPRISKWPPEIIIHPAGPDPGPMAALTRLTASVAEGLVELAADVESLRQRLKHVSGQVRAPSERSRGTSKKR